MTEVLFPLSGKRVWVAGHGGMAGSAIVRRLAREDCTVLSVGRDEVDLRRQSQVEEWLEANRPDAIFLAAATVGGIHANASRPAEFIYDNLAIQTNIIHGAWRVGVAKLLFLGSSCIYPRMASQPVREDALLTGPLEPTNDAYAVAKIAGITMCQAYRRQYGCDFIAAMPTNLYGLGDRYDVLQGHVVAALIMKIHQAKVEGRSQVEIWGSGTPTREFLFSEDLADALVFLMTRYSGLSHVNVGTGIETSITALATAIAGTVGYQGGFAFDRSKPDGTPRKVMDVSRLTQMGWTAPTALEEGLRHAYAWYLEHHAAG